GKKNRKYLEMSRLRSTSQNDQNRGPPLPLSLAASSGIFLRRRRRNQLFQVLRRLSRGVRYRWLSSLLLRIWARIPFTEKSSVFKMVYAVPTAAACCASLAATMGRFRTCA